MRSNGDSRGIGADMLMYSLCRLSKCPIKVVYKVTHPNGKIYIGQDVTDGINCSTVVRNWMRHTQPVEALRPQ
jgi:hypothetical protein